MNILSSFLCWIGGSISFRLSLVSEVLAAIRSDAPTSYILTYSHTKSLVPKTHWSCFLELVVSALVGF